MNTKNLIFDLCSVYGVSGFEEPAVLKAKKYLERFAEVKTDSNGNLTAYISSQAAHKTILLDAHIDRIGFIVTGIDDDGFVRVDKCGGVDVRTLCDCEIVLQKNPNIKGVVCCMPPHLTNGSEDKADDLDKIRIDFGMSAEQAKSLFSLGDVLTFESKPVELLNGRIASAALDNRCSAAVLIMCAEKLHREKNLPYNIEILLSSQEETYAKGAKTGAFSSDADESVVVDVSFASQPDVSGFYSSIELGAGPMIGISPTLDKQITNKLISLAQTENIPYQLETLSASTGTNADHISTTKGGIKTALVSIPQRYMHTQNEVIEIADAENTARLICEYILTGGADGE